MIRTTRYTINTTPSQIASGNNAIGSQPKIVKIKVVAAGQSVFIGGVTRTGSDTNGGAAYTVASSGAQTGLELVTGNTPETFTLYQGDTLFAVVNATTQDIIVLENTTN